MGLAGPSHAAQQLAFQTQCSQPNVTLDPTTSKDKNPQSLFLPPASCTVPLVHQKNKSSPETLHTTTEEDWVHGGESGHRAEASQPIASRLEKGQGREDLAGLWGAKLPSMGVRGGRAVA